MSLHSTFRFDWSLEVEQNPIQSEALEIDWTESPDVEVVTGKASGKPLLFETQFPADMLVAYHESQVMHGMRLDEAFAKRTKTIPTQIPTRLRRVPGYAHSHQPEHQP